jgi:hypothetical protein
MYQAHRKRVPCVVQYCVVQSWAYFLSSSLILLLATRHISCDEEGRQHTRHSTLDATRLALPTDIAIRSAVGVWARRRAPIAAYAPHAPTIRYIHHNVCGTSSSTAHPSDPHLTAQAPHAQAAL